MPNKVIVRSKKVEEVIPSESSIELRRLNARLQHEDISEDELAHYGVMGMHWGVRNDKGGASNGSSAKAARKEEKDLNRAAGKAMSLANRKYLSIYNAMADESAAFYSKINSNPKYKNLSLVNERDRSSPLAKSYWKECADAATKSLQSNSDRILGSKVDSRLKVTWYMGEEMGSMPSFYIERADNIQHADEVDRIKLIPKFDKSGKLLSIDFPKDIFEDEESELKHYGVMGMHWGVRNDKGGASNGSSIGSKIKSAYNKSPFDEKQVRKDWDTNTEGLSTRQKAGLLLGLGPYWGAKAAAKIQAKNADPKEIMKKETKTLRKKIASDFSKRSDAELAAHEAEFKAKYPKETALAGLKRGLTSKEGRAKNAEMGKVYSDMLTKRMEKMLNEVAADNLAGTKYKINSVKGLNDWLPDFEITTDD